MAKLKENIKVESVKYDMDKTKKRKRKDFMVTAKSERAVIEKLERIHKGEKVQQIIELNWGEGDSAPGEVIETYNGTVKFYEEEKGFGFIKADAKMDDLFFHASALGNGIVGDEDRVSFEISEGPKGLIATQVQLIDS
jgi:CspA family cold shock protein